MRLPSQMRTQLSASLTGSGTAIAVADRLCRTCVDLLDVDGAAISLMRQGATQGTFGSSGQMSRQVDEYQFTFGEGPCLDSVTSGRPVLVPDLEDLAEARWPAFRDAALGAGISAVFALPVLVATSRVGALDLFRRTRGPLSPDELAAGLFAAELAAGPLRELLTGDLILDDADADGSERAGTASRGELGTLERIEVYQATGMLVGAFDLSPDEALLRLRGYAYAHGQTASDVAWAIVERRLLLDRRDWDLARDVGEEDS